MKQQIKEAILSNKFPLLVTAPTGCGAVYLTKEAIKESKIPFYEIVGNKMDILRKLKSYSKENVLITDFDNQDIDIINILKGACDGGEIFYYSLVYSEKFKFEGKIILVANKAEESLASRCFHIDITDNKSFKDVLGKSRYLNFTK